MAEYWSAFARTVAASPALVAGWVALAAVFAVGSTWLLRRFLPRAATDNPVRRIVQNSAFPMAAALGNGFGGYLALRAVQLDPEVFRCAVAINTPADLAAWSAATTSAARV